MADTPTNERPSKRGSLLTRLLIAGFMGLVVAAECLFAYFWLPSADQVAAQTEQIVNEAKARAEPDKEKEGEEDVEVTEVDLGEFTITNHRLANEATFRIDFHMYATVAEKDKDKFDELYGRNEHRFRDQVIFECRNSEVSDLTDAGLGLIKRRILAKSNALIGKPLLRSVFFAEYSFVEL